MSSASVPVVAGDFEEEATRRAYHKVLEASLPVVQALASRRAARSPGPKEVTSTAGESWPLSTPFPPTSVEVRRTALEAGWLISSTKLRTHGAGRLQGLDVAVKDLIDVSGLPVRNGTPGGLWRNPTASAPVWERLAAAGARCVGKAATHEMAWGVTTPAISNPHDSMRYAGGSSGGSAACVASGAAHGALGTDTGGSIRIPAALCGVVGIRPTHGVIRLDGITPLSPSQDVVGPIARDIATCAAMLEELLCRSLGPASEVMRPWRVGVLASSYPLDDEVAAAYDHTLAALARHGVEVVECDRTPLRDSSAVSVVMMLAESAALHEQAVRAEPLGFGGEARALLTVGTEVARQNSLLRRARHALRMNTADVFSDHRLDAFLTPTTPCVAPLRGRSTVRLGGREVPVTSALTQFTGWSAATGWPAISVPVPASSLPVGMQLMAQPSREDVCLRLGDLLLAPNPQ